MAYVTLEQAKDHLRVEIADDDFYITDLIAVSEQSIENEIGSTLASNLSGGVLPKPLYQAILLLIGHLYATREPVMVGVSVVKCPFTLEYLIYPYKTWTCK
jgi:hypothetical protein